MVFYIQQKVSEKTYVKKEKENMLILGNGRVITRDESMPFLENGAVALAETLSVRWALWKK